MSEGVKRRFVLLLACAACTGEPPDPPGGARDGGRIVLDSGVIRDGGNSEQRDGGTSARDGGATAPRDGGETPRDGGALDCVLHAGGPAQAPSVTHGNDVADVSITADDPCGRTYALSTSAPLRDNPYGNPRTIAETDGPFLRSGNTMLDALYAMAVAEARELSVAAIADGAFDDGNPVTCPAPGCFETGRLWHWVWTRDIAYASDLGLALIDPPRMRSSLELKLSTRRDGTDRQIIQDTGSGGSYPVSTDRVSWALGARRLLAVLEDGAPHEALAREAIINTIEHDRVVAYDPVDGLYRGEQSFLDWREQSNAPWTAQDTVHLAMSKALSTNVLHLIAIREAARLADRDGDTTAAARYEGWADALATAIHARFWIADEQMWSSHVPTTLDAAPARRFDLLGQSLAVLAGIGDKNAAVQAVASYPNLPYGPPVMWPQSSEVPIYHNRAIWPFVTAYGARAAKHVGNAAVITHAAKSLYDGAALNLSNMENLEVETGHAWVEDGANSGPVVNSQRQLWSVAAFFTLVNEIVFGIDPTTDGLDFEPGLTRALRREWFGGVDRIALNDVPWRGSTITVEVVLPAENAMGDAVFVTSEVVQNGDRVVITLEDSGADATDMRLVTDGQIFAPPTPSIAGVAVATNLRLTLDRAGADPSAVTWSIYRDGVRIADQIPGSQTTFDDPNATAASDSHCYAVELVGTNGNASHRSAPSCWWGNGFERTASYYASGFAAVGGTFVNNHGRDHYEAWGDPGHTLTLASFTPSFSGPHYIQLTAGNGAGGFTTGITCGIKRVRIEELPGGNVVGEGYVVMPHLGTWSQWADSSFVPVDLFSDRSYRIVVDMDDRAVNMSAFDHYVRYTGGMGGRDGSFFRVNISEIKVLARTGQP